MEVIPAVDIQDGKCVRLLQGDFDREVVYGENPIEMAEHWAEQGAKRLHVVDLDGARTGQPCNLDLIEGIASRLEIPVQLGGGIRNLDTIKKYLDVGIDRVILGTVALENPELVAQAVKLYGTEKIVVGVDAREGKVAVEGWQETSEKKVEEVITSLKEKGVTTFIYTDISRDGMLEGPDVSGLQDLLKIEGIEVIASGGISSREDIDKLTEIGIEKGIVGKALYSGEIDPAECWT
ncbi:MAG: 1-(5-phosphoribosyl)-5-[(5-phosphoribosylamino)methylideneamino]imidazole-4-carboxamide isomerase [Halanaerobiaceae bacterium]